MRLSNDMIVECEECGNQIIIFGNDVDFEVTSVEERGMGEEISYDATEERNCENCGNEIVVRINAWEYPIGVLNYDDNSVSGGTFTVSPTINLSVLPIEVYDFDQDEDDYREVLHSIIDEIKLKRKEMKDLSPEQFEDLVKELFERKGFVVEKTQQTRDGGKDLIAKADVGGIPFVVFIECKHHKNKIGIELVRQLYGVQTVEGVNQAILVTSSSFTKDAVDFSNRTKHLIKLIDGKDILSEILDKEE